MDGLVYLPGVGSQEPGPLSRYLPVVADGIAAAYLDRNAKMGGWVLDPFGAFPGMGFEMARLGYRVLVAVNNPVTRFIYETSADPPTLEEMRLALAELAAVRKGDERLENHLQSLYMTECSRCRKQVPAEAFIWEAAKSVPTGRIYHCDCGEGGEYPATEADQARAAGFKLTDGLHRSRALEQVALPDDPDRVHVQAALKCYLPRAIYALITIINKLEGISLSPRLRRALQAVILVACDETNVLWSHPEERPRPTAVDHPAALP